MSNSFETAVLIAEMIAGAICMAVAAIAGRHSLAKPLEITKNEKGFGVNVNGWAALLLLGCLLLLAPLYQLREAKKDEATDLTKKLQDCTANCVECAKKVSDLDQYEIRMEPAMLSTNSNQQLPDPAAMQYHVFVRTRPNEDPHEIPVTEIELSPVVSVRVSGLHVSDRPQVVLEAVDPHTGRCWRSKEAPAAFYLVAVPVPQTPSS
jgi:hypothetical protein